MRHPRENNRQPSRSRRSSSNSSFIDVISRSRVSVLASLIVLLLLFGMQLFKNEDVVGVFPSIDPTSSNIEKSSSFVPSEDQIDPDSSIHKKKDESWKDDSTDLMPLLSTSPSASPTTSTLEQKQQQKSVGPPPLEPVRIFEEYMQQHSHYSLMMSLSSSSSGYAGEGDEGRNETKTIEGKRKFALVPYLCPDRAGNFLHNMFNSMIWSIITNRTILWQYIGQHNSVEDCQHVLKRAEWIPSYNEWSMKLQLDPPVPWKKHDDDEKEEQPQVVIFPQIDDTYHEYPGIERISWREHPMKRQVDKARIQSMGSDVAQLARDLYSEGTNFLFGLLFRQCFEMLVDRPFDGWTSPQREEGVVSIALHSRHPVNGDDGTFVDEEKSCLTKLLTNHYMNRQKHHEFGCQIHLMSDRKATINILSNWVQDEYNCTVIVASHNSSSSINDATHYTPLQLEHGPWAGIGFIEDLAAASLARTAIIGDDARSSTMLLAELIDYEQHITSWNQNKSTHRLDMCQLQSKQQAGYNYGPGTPTFIRHNKRPKLVPVQVINKYKKLHSNSSISSSILIDDGHDDPTNDDDDNDESMDDDNGPSFFQDRDRDHHHHEYVVIDYDDCHNNPVAAVLGEASAENNTIHQFYNNIIFAIVSNRTIFFREVGEEVDECLDMPTLHSWIPIIDENMEVLLNNNNDWKDMSYLLPNSSKMFQSSDDVLQHIHSSSTTSERDVNYDATTTEVANQLFDEGNYYLYGMIFFELFHLPSVVNPLSIPIDYDPDIEYALNTIALYYNVADENENKDSSEVIRCLETIVNTTNLPCHVYIMDDHLTTTTTANNNNNNNNNSMIIHTWLTEKNCKIWKANKYIGDEEEHQLRSLRNNDDAAAEDDDDVDGKLSFSNATTTTSSFTANTTVVQFFRDLYFVSKAKTAYVGPLLTTPKSQLLIEWMEYSLQNHIWKDGRFPSLHNPNLTKCILH